MYAVTSSVMSSLTSAAAAAAAIATFIVIVQLSQTAANNATLSTEAGDTVQVHPEQRVQVTTRLTSSAGSSASVTATTALVSTTHVNETSWLNDTSSNSSTNSANVESGTQSPDGGGGKTSPEADNTKLMIGLAMGFGVIIALVIGLCIFWRFCCRMMNSQASGKTSTQDILLDLQSGP